MSVSAAETLLLLVGVLAGYAAEEHVLDWTVEGVDKYREDPLEVKFGDVLTLNCHPTNISNFVYVESREQYDSCNASATDGKVLKSGDCLGRFSDAKSFSQNIQRLSGAGQAVVEYQAGKLFYFYSSANGSLVSGKPPYIGGQCLEGLKMIIYVVDESIPSTITLPRLSPSVTLDKPGGTGKGSGGGVLSVTYGILIGVAIVVAVVIVIVNLALCAWCVRKRSKTGRMDEITERLPTISNLPSKTPAVRIGKNSVSFTQNEDQKSTGKDEKKGSVVDNGKKERTGAAAGGKQPSQVNGGGKKKKVNGAKVTTNPPKSSNGREARGKSESTPTNNANNTPKNNNAPKNNNNIRKNNVPRQPAPPPPVDAAKRSAVRSSSSDPATTATGRSSLTGTGQSPTKSNSTGPNRK